MSKWTNHRYRDDEIWWNDQFESREEAIADGVKQYKTALNGFATDLFDDDPERFPSDVFYIGECIRFVPTVDAERVLEQLEEDAYDECGEAAENFLDWNYITDDKIADLQENLQRELDSWLERYKCTPTFYSIENVEKIDVEDYL